MMGTLKCGECGSHLKIEGDSVEGCYDCYDKAYCEGLEDGRSGAMSGEKRRFVEVEQEFYEKLRAYAKENEVSMREAVTIILSDFMKRDVVVA